MDAALCTENIYICLFQKYLGIVKLFKTLRVFQQKLGHNNFRSERCLVSADGLLIHRRGEER